MTDIITPGALQQAATFDPTGGFRGNLMSNFALPSSAPAQMPSYAPEMLPSMQGGPVQMPPGMQPQGIQGPGVQAQGVQAPGPQMMPPQTLGALSQIQQRPNMRPLSAQFEAGPQVAQAMGPAPSIPYVQSPTGSWRVAQTDPRFWSNNPNVLQQTDPVSIAGALNHFGGPETQQQRAAMRALYPDLADADKVLGMGTVWERANDQQNQNKWLYDYIYNRIDDKGDSPLNQAYAAQLGKPNGYTKDQWADLLYRQQAGERDAELARQRAAQPAPKPVFDEYGVADWQRGPQTDYQT